MLLKDLKYAAGTLRKNPGYAWTAILSLALGIAANTVFFTIYDTFALRRLPVPHPEELVQVTSANSLQIGTSLGSRRNHYSYPLYQDLVERSGSLARLSCRNGRTLNGMVQSIPEQIQADLVSGNFFEVLGVTPAMGRLLNTQDEQEVQNRPVAVLSYRYWQRRFGGNPRVIGETLFIERQPVFIVGVTGEGFRSIELGKSTDVYLPVTMAAFLDNPGILRMRRYIWLEIIGRLNPGIKREQAQSALSPIFQQLLENDIRYSPEIPDYVKRRYLKQSLDLQPGGQGIDWMQRKAVNPLIILWIAVSAVLLIACANVAGLQLAQAERRRKEIALRLGLGASRVRLMGLLLTESLLLAFLGGLLGLLIAWWSMSGLEAMISEFITLEDFSSLNLRVLGITALLSFGSTLLFGFAPALYATRENLFHSLRNETIVFSAHGHNSRRLILVISQIALSMLLLASAGLFLRSFWNLYRIDLGFARDNLLLVEIDPRPDQYAPEQIETLMRALLEKVRMMPGVKSAALAKDKIASSHYWDVITTDIHSDPQREDLEINNKAIDPGYFSSLGIPILSGRDFASMDTKNSPIIAIVNQAFARYYFPDQNPVGKHFKRPGYPPPMQDVEIVGVVANAAFADIRNKEERVYFLPLNQTGFSSAVLQIRIGRNPRQIAVAIRREMALLDPALPLTKIRMLEEDVIEEASGNRVMAIMTFVFGATATILAAIGIFGLLSFFVAQRTREIGIRMALGEERSGAVWLVLKQTIVAAGIGLMIGISATLAVSRYLRSMLYEVQPIDPITLILTVFLIGAVALIAAWIPARHAAAVDPMIALRSE